MALRISAGNCQFMLSEIQHGFKQFCEICFLDFKESLTLTAQNYEWYGFWMAVVTTFIMVRATFKPKIFSYLTFKVYVLWLSGLPKRFKHNSLCYKSGVFETFLVRKQEDIDSIYVLKWKKMRTKHSVSRLSFKVAQAKEKPAKVRKIFWNLFI